MPTRTEKPDGRGEIHPVVATAQRDGARRHRDKAYDQRDELLAALTKVFPSHLMPTSVERLNFKWAVCVHLPTGQVCYHLSDASVDTYFQHLERHTTNHWDGTRMEVRSVRLFDLPLNWR